MAFFKKKKKEEKVEEKGKETPDFEKYGTYSTMAKLEDTLSDSDTVTLNSPWTLSALSSNTIAPLTTAQISSLSSTTLNGYTVSPNNWNTVPQTITLGPAWSNTYSTPYVTTTAGSSTYGVGSTFTVNNGSSNSLPPNAVDVKGDFVITGDLTIGGVSLKKTLEAICDRLAVLVPDEERMEKYASLRAAYDHYKTLEALIGKDTNEPKK